jgi:hypothetical protein
MLLTPIKVEQAELTKEHSSPAISSVPMAEWSMA